MDRRLVFLAAAAGLVGGLAGCAQRPGPDRSGVAAACAAPYVHADRAEVHPGESLTVTGMAFLASCHDTGTFGRPVPEDIPLRQIEVLWRQGEDVFVVGEADAGPDGAFQLSITVPMTAVTGTAALGATFDSVNHDDAYVADGDVVDVLDE